MSFDIFFMPCRFAEASVEEVDPLTRNSRRKLPNEPLTPEELSAVQRVLAAKSASSRAKSQYIFHFSDGGYAEFYGEHLESGCMVAVRGEITPQVIAFLYDLLHAGCWVMIPAMRETCAIATSAIAFKRVPEKFPRQVVCGSPEEIGQLLREGFEAWVAYRDQVVSKSKDSQP